MFLILNDVLVFGCECWLVVWGRNPTYYVSIHMVSKIMIRMHQRFGSYNSKFKPINLNSFFWMYRLGAAKNRAEKVLQGCRKSKENTTRSLRNFQLYMGQNCSYPSHQIIFLTLIISGLLQLEVLYKPLTNMSYSHVTNFNQRVPIHV